MMNRNIKKVAVLGSGVMGSRIACHFANIGLDTLLLDILPKELLPEEAAKGISIESKLFRNRIVNAALDATLKANPSALYKKSASSKIKVGNFEDDLSKISDCDWVIEAVVENVEIKKSLYEKLELHRKPGTLISSNTSGIPIFMMAEGRTEDFQKNFCGTHFFNPPRYLKLFEVIPSPKTDASVIDFFMNYGDLFLGKTTVLCKDTPAFIANRIGIYSIMEIFAVSQKLELSVEDVDKLTGPVLGRPRSATFRTGDVVGLDTLVNVCKNLANSLPNDETKNLFIVPDYLQKMIDNKWLGDKTGQGFYKKSKNAEGKTEILSLDIKSGEYKTQVKSKFITLEQTKTIDDLRLRLKVLVKGQDKAGDFYRATFGGLFAYVSNRIPEISDEIYRIDDALKAGFGWELGPFEMWEAIGIKEGIELIKTAGKTPAAWVLSLCEKTSFTAFYASISGKKFFYDIPSTTLKVIPGTESYILLDNFRSNKKVWSNAGATLHDIGDGVLNLEFHSKMNTLGSEVIQAINKSISIAEKDFKGLVIANEGANFSVGANLALLLMNAFEQEWDEINMMVAQFQKTMMRARYSAVPVVVAPHNMALGGGCELTLHADVVVAHAELYTGLVEFGVGLIPAGGGSKELTLRASDANIANGIDFMNLQNNYMTIAMAKVSSSAYEAIENGILRSFDKIVLNRNRQIITAKEEVIELYNAGYTKPIERKDIKVLGKAGMANFFTGAASMLRGGYISEHDLKISQKLAYVMCGGDLSYPQMVSEQYLLDLEREAFVSLCGEKKTLERIKAMLETGKPLRN
ncbi:MAG: 3-hydroxyacyl-CoA dehydrogenase/enoyl-CoA hydratase family protein [Cytophagales bacterium]|nr:MAG: 3-hydroxyacyl-CoA dehydrogenase/enoyl-CoA hydratase family protein [Cytophagales bacterium]